MAAAKVQERLVYDTDAGGIATGAWPNLIPDVLPRQWIWIPKAWIGAQLQLASG
jgi:hypothetical protein